jgi:signal transduction histidine kinase/CheY-like chemotaxis protein/HPt (histidine-containing phosphotransfer) domain-containing protein
MEQPGPNRVPGPRKIPAQAPSLTPRNLRRGRTALIAAVTALMLSVPWVTWMAYERLLGSVDAISQLEDPNNERLLIVQIRRLVAENGNAVLRYALTRSAEDLQQYQHSRRQLDAILDSRMPDPSRDSLRTLIETRYELLDSWVSLVQRYRSPELSPGSSRQTQTISLAEEEAALSHAIERELESMDRNAMYRAVDLTNISRHQNDRTRKLIRWYGFLATGLLFLLATGLILLFRRADRVQESLERTLDREQSLVRAREAFLANLSHELRTPLHAIQGFADRLVHAQLPERQGAYAVIIADASRHLSGLVEHVLDYARESSLSSAPRREPVAPSVLLTEVRDLVLPHAEAKGLSLECAVQEQVPALLLTDRLRLRQALLNLAGNAVKFTPRGLVQLRAGGRAQEPGQFELVLEVQDSGPGIPEADRERIFEPFRQGGEEPGAYRQGLGLGLAITADLVRHLGGTLSLESEPGRGSLFRIALVLEVAGEGRQEPQAAEAGVAGAPDAALFPRVQKASAPRRLRILAADDEPFNRRLLESMLSDSALEVVHDGIQALEAFQNQPADLLLLDVRMPGLDGHATLRAIRAFAPQVPAVAMTAGVSPEEREACRQSGFDAVLPKPFAEGELRALLERLTGAGQPDTPFDPTETRGAAADDEPGTLDLSGLEALAEEGDTFVSDMLQLFLERLQATRQEWEEALARGDTRQVGALAHRLAAPARQLGYAELAAALRALESEAESGASAEALANRCRRLQPMLHTAALRVAAELEKTRPPR